MVKGIFLAGKGITHFNRKDERNFTNNLDWLIHAFIDNGIEDLTIVGGQGIEKLDYQKLSYIYNNQWKNTGPLYSLFLAKKILLSDDCLISYSDVVYRPSLVKDLIALNADISIVTDTSWKTRYPERTPKSIEMAEKVWLDSNNTVKNIERGNINKSQGEFTGLIFIKKGMFQKILDLYNPKDILEANDLDLTSFFSTLMNADIKVKSLVTEGNWAELDPIKSDGKHWSDFHRFVFGTKSQTLDRLKPLLKTGKILTQLNFTVDEWQENRRQLTNQIKTFFNNKYVVVRSSALNEDSMVSSMAGHFISKLNVVKDQESDLQKAIDDVVSAYGKAVNPRDQILVQPQIPNVTMSGVLFTCDIRTGAPYYTINYSLSGDTDLITSGGKGDYHLVHIYKGFNSKIENKLIEKLCTCAEDLERLTGNYNLDIEFAFDSSNKLFIFQARPITSYEVIENYNKYSISDTVKNIKKRLNLILNRKPNLCGNKTILGDMPDWNPAELLGSNPKPLAISLFDYLITYSVWRDARHDLGYFNPHSERLLHILGGHPYIDVRNSLNSLTPIGLSNELREKLVNESIEYLARNPASHDKYEFEVATTCLTPYINYRKERWLDFGFKESEIEDIVESYRQLTKNIISGDYIDSLLNNLNILDSRRKKIISRKTNTDNYYKISVLIEDCKKFGTRSFSSLARLAFIGSTFFKSFLSSGIISQSEYDAFTTSIVTIATELSEKIELVRNGKLGIDVFLNEYGHLRPGTWEIESFSYSEKPEIYFENLKSNSSKVPKYKNANNFIFSKKSKKEMQAALGKLKIEIEIDELIEFTVKSIQAREYSKFLFSRSVSDILSLICKIGKELRIERSNLSFLEFKSIVDFGFYSRETKNVSSLQKEIDFQKREYNKNQQLVMPQLILSKDNIDFVEYFESRPNYITSKKVNGKLVEIYSSSSSVSIDNKIVMIESADPGFDWIFTHKIVGVITKYGGAASHMAIRCSEFDLPAAIGVGHDYDLIKEFDSITIDCSNKKWSNI